MGEVRRAELRGYARLLLAAATIAVLAWALFLAAGCAGIGRLTYVDQTVAPAAADSTAEQASIGPVVPWRPLFSDTLIGFVSGSSDSTRRYLGRLRTGYTADTLNVILFGDNRPAYRSTRLRNDLVKIREMISFNPAKIVRGLIAIPVVFVKGMIPDLALVRDIPAAVRSMPTYGREQQVLQAMEAKIDSMQAHGQNVAAIINTGDVVKDGRRPAHWERFLRLTHPVSSKVPYFLIAGNHERTDTDEGISNWRTATGLPVGGDRLYYCFDSADGWVRFIAIDTNPITNTNKHWSREVEIKYSDEQFDWLVSRVKEHMGPAFIFMHHPPFSVGYHRDEWQSDEVLRERRHRMMQALHDTGISVLAGGHEHAYERALITWPDAVLIMVVTGGGGTPLLDISPPAQSAQLFSEYKVAGSVIKPENTLTAEVFHFSLVRLWFGGGQVQAFEVLKDASTKLFDKVDIDLTRYGVPKIDQKKMVLPPETGPRQPPEEIQPGDAKTTAATPDTSGKKLVTEPPPGDTTPKPPLKKKQATRR